jgi:hypothetical protein
MKERTVSLTLMCVVSACFIDNLSAQRRCTIRMDRERPSGIRRSASR